MRNTFWQRLIGLWLCFLCHTVFAGSDPLPSWNDGIVKRNIIAFVKTVTDKNSPHYVPPADRIATFDNDGTLWVEQPMYTQVVFAAERLKALLPQHPEWREQEPYKTLLQHGVKHYVDDDFNKLISATENGLTVEAFTQVASDWLNHAVNPRFKRLYKDDVYQPMMEVISYLKQNQFDVYIVSGGGQAFIRAYAPQAYGIPVNKIIGTTLQTQYSDTDKHPQLVKSSDILYTNDEGGKVSGIYLFIGKKPIIAFGNSGGDRAMLEWTQSGPGKRLMLLVHHDDAKREYNYGNHSKVGNFPDDLMQEAVENHWQVISMKNDWKVIFKPSGSNSAPAVIKVPHDQGLHASAS